jgi:N4-gp56 family major capsid protein
MADQKSIVEFRGNAKNVPSYWLADRIDQMAFLTLAGISYAKKNNGAARVGSDLPYLEFAADITAPSNGRRFRWDNTAKGLIAAGASSAVTATDTIAWEMFVQLKAAAKDRYVRGVMEGSEETYHAFVTPTVMANLKLDPTYLLNLRHSQSADKNGTLFSGSSVKIDGIYLHEFRHVPNTVGALSGSKYGSLGTVEGCQVLFCGAQALGMADIGAPDWTEKGFDFENQQAIAIGKILGFLKPKFGSIYENGAVEDFGVMSVYVAQK